MDENGKTNILRVRHTSYVLQQLDEQRRRGLFCDAVLMVEGEKFKVHRSFLAANSDYFLSLFTSAEEQHNFVLAGVPLQGFRVILDFIYTSTFELNVSNVNDAHKASTALNFKHVQAACEKVYLKIRQMKESNFPFQTVSRHSISPEQKVGQNGGSLNKKTAKSPTRINGKPGSAPLGGRKSGEISCSPPAFGSINFIKREPIDLTEQETQLTPINLKRKVKSEEESESEEEFPAKRSRNNRSESSAECKVAAQSSTDNREFDRSLPCQSPTSSTSSSSSSKENNERNQEATNLLSPTHTNTKEGNSRNTRIVSDIKLPRKNSRHLLRWPSDPSLNYKNSTCDGSLHTARNNHKTPGSLLDGSSTKSSRDYDKLGNEKLFSKWKLVSTNEVETNHRHCDGQERVQRNRRKMLKTNKIHSNTE